jgi:hypothetical protein
MVEIAVGILQAEPDARIRPARQWAVALLQYYSTEVPLPDEVASLLIEEQLPGRGVSLPFIARSTRQHDLCRRRTRRRKPRHERESRILR